MHDFPKPEQNETAFSSDHASDEVASSDSEEVSQKPLKRKPPPLEEARSSKKRKTGQNEAAGLTTQPKTPKQLKLPTVDRTPSPAVATKKRKPPTPQQRYTKEQLLDKTLPELKAICQELKFTTTKRTKATIAADIYDQQIQQSRSKK